MQLTIKNLSKTYANGVRALKNVSLTVHQGMFGILGQNGAGKSTLIRTIATLQQPDRGSIEFDGVNVLREPNQLRKRLGYLPQEFGVYPNVSAEELLLHIANLKGIVAKGERKDRVQALLQQVNLYRDRKKHLNGYSGGMKQRFGIAQALLNDPQLIIVDEPTAGLDPMERNRFYNLLASLGENAVVILSTHLVEDVNTLCNDMAIIGKGEVVLRGKPADIQTSLNGKIWEKEIKTSDFDHYTSEYNVISNRFHQGNMSITISQPHHPKADFVAKTPTLEDVYFKVLHDREQKPTHQDV